MKKPDLSTDNVVAYVVFSDGSTFEGLSNDTAVVLVEHPDGAIMYDCDYIDPTLQSYCDACVALGADAGSDPMVPVEATDEHNEKVQVRTVSVDFLLRYYLANRAKGGPIGIE